MSHPSLGLPPRDVRAGFPDAAVRLVRDRARIAFPVRLYVGAWLMGVLPPAWTDGWLARLPKKG